MIAMKRRAAAVGWTRPEPDLDQADAGQFPHHPLNGVRALEVPWLDVERAGEVGDVRSSGLSVRTKVRPLPRCPGRFV